VLSQLSPYDLIKIILQPPTIYLHQLEGGDYFPADQKKKIEARGRQSQIVTFNDRDFKYVDTFGVIILCAVEGWKFDTMD